jgi:hypothetical protein
MGIVGLGLGVYLGLLHQSKFYYGMTQYEYPESWSIPKAIARLLIGLCAALPSLGLY